MASLTLDQLAKLLLFALKRMRHSGVSRTQQINIQDDIPVNVQNDDCLKLFIVQIIIVTSGCGFACLSRHLCPWARHLNCNCFSSPRGKWVPVRADMVLDLIWCAT